PGRGPACNRSHDHGRLIPPWDRLCKHQYPAPGVFGQDRGPESPPRRTACGRRFPPLQQSLPRAPRPVGRAARRRSWPMRCFCGLLAAVGCVVGLSEVTADAGKKGKAGVEKTEFGKTPEGTAVDLYTLTNAAGVKAKVITYGTILTELHVPDRTGKTADVV